MAVKVLVTRLDPDLPLPKYAKGGDAGRRFGRTS
jgi:dUTP pyrophosphatase